MELDLSHYALSPEERESIIARTEALLSRIRAPEYAGVYPTREEALELVFSHTQSPSLRAHMLAVEASMAAYAQELGADEHAYRMAGLLHDFDYEQNPHPTEHPLVGCELLADRGYPAELIEAVLGHALYCEVPRQSAMARCLFAVDELTGFLSAIAYVRPNGLEGLKWKSFNKKFKTPNFAAAIHRGEVEFAAAEFGVELRDHVLFLAAALNEAFPEFPQVPEAAEPV